MKILTQLVTLKPKQPFLTSRDRAVKSLSRSNTTLSI